MASTKTNQFPHAFMRDQILMSCHVMSCLVMSCHVMSCHVMSRHVMSCHVHFQTPRTSTILYLMGLTLTDWLMNLHLQLRFCTLMIALNYRYYRYYYYYYPYVFRLVCCFLGVDPRRWLLSYGGVRRGVSKGVEDSRKPLALQAGHP
jgi:hypothetical protein